MDNLNTNEAIEDLIYTEGNNILEISNKFSTLITNKLDSLGI